MPALPQPYRPRRTQPPAPNASCRLHSSRGASPHAATLYLLRPSPTTLERPYPPHRLPTACVRRRHPSKGEGACPARPTGSSRGTDATERVPPEMEGHGPLEGRAPSWPGRPGCGMQGGTPRQWAPAGQAAAPHTTSRQREPAVSIEPRALARGGAAAMLECRLHRGLTPPAPGLRLRLVIGCTGG